MVFSILFKCSPRLRASKGSIVAVTSAATDRYPIRDGLSAGPKAAVEMLIRGLAAEEGKHGVRANAVGPGMLSVVWPKTLLLKASTASRIWI